MTRRTLFLMGVAGAAGCRRDRRPRLNVFNWSSYVGPETIPAFEREFGVRVRYAVYESNEEMLARVMSGNSGWDVVFPTSYLIQPMHQLNLLAPLDHARLPNLRHLDAVFQKPAWDPELRWGVPYMWNATGICYSKTLPDPLTEWADMWDSALQGSVTMLDDPVDVFAACLKMLGHSINTQNPDELRAAQQEAIEQKELLRAYINAEVRDQLIAGDVLAAQLWSTTSQQAIDESSNLAFAYPEEGFPLYPDNAVILRESSRSELAHRFIDYLLRPEVAAGVVRGARTATANGSARALLEPALRNNPTLYPPPEVMSRGEWALTSTPEIQKLRDRLWTEIKSA
jgi:spermidine/putrescine transport system substrate-binding protein